TICAIIIGCMFSMWTSSSTRINKALKSFCNGDRSEAITQMESVIQEGSEDPAHWNAMGFAYSEVNRHEEAVKAYEKALELNEKYHRPGTTNTLYYRNISLNLVQSLYFLGRYERGISILHSLLAFNQKDVRAYNDLALLYNANGDFPNAMFAANSAIKIRPKFYSAHSHLGHALLKLGNLLEAERNIRKALQLAPDYPRAHYYYALLYLEKNQGEDALRECQAALDLDPSFQEARDLKSKLEQTG
ncbi:MAG: tetratricopeptide repeat protein, partial [Promethearchaeota archaeon]